MRSNLKKMALGLLGIVVIACVAFSYAWVRFMVAATPPEEVAFSSQGLNISGKLIKPEGEGPFPVVVILHGSGPMTKEQMAFTAQGNAFARSGIAAIYLSIKEGAGRQKASIVTQIFVH
jgi:poly(3-hydroxybutyrate) depolymerase